MIEAVLSILIVFLTYIFYIIWVKPVRAMKNYAKLLRSRGYKVYEMPYSPMKYHTFNLVQKGYEKGDAMQFHKELVA